MYVTACSVKPVATEPVRLYGGKPVVNSVAPLPLSCPSPCFPSLCHYTTPAPPFVSLSAPLPVPPSTSLVPPVLLYLWPLQLYLSLATPSAHLPSLRHYTTPAPIRPSVRVHTPPPHPVRFHVTHWATTSADTSSTRSMPSPYHTWAGSMPTRCSIPASGVVRLDGVTAPEPPKDNRTPLCRSARPAACSSDRYNISLVPA